MPSKIMRNAPTVSELLKKLQSVKDKNLPIYLRSKYSGDIKYFEEIPLNINGVTELATKHNDGEEVIDRVVFLF